MIASVRTSSALRGMAFPAAWRNGKLVCAGGDEEFFVLTDIRITVQDPAASVLRAKAKVQSLDAPSELQVELLSFDSDGSEQLAPMGLHDLTKCAFWIELEGKDQGYRVIQRVGSDDRTFIVQSHSINPVTGREGL